MRRAGAHFERGDTGQITMRDSPLERALARKTITPEQYAAAQKYRHHWYFGGLHDHLGSLDLTRILAGHHGDYSGMARSENQAFHRQRFRRAHEDRPRRPVQALGHRLIVAGFALAQSGSGLPRMSAQAPIR